MQDSLPEQSMPDKSPPPKGKAKRMRWLKLLGGASTLTLLPALAMAANARGCTLPYHSTSIDVTRTGTSVPLRIAGQSADGALLVQVQAAQTVTRTSAGPVSTEGWVTVGGMVPEFNAEQNVWRFDFNANVPLSAWPKDRTLVLRTLEVTPAGDVQPQYTFAPNGAATPHNLLGYVDLPSTSGFPNLADFPPNARFSNQLPGNFLSAKGDTNNAGAAYYSTIGAPGNFIAWRSKNGFPTGEIVTYYRNENDLGFGREMRCRIVAVSLVPTKISCYVTNYANENDAASRKNRTATVAMEWSLGGFPRADGNGVLDPAETIRFYVYDTGDGNNADLDKDGIVQDLIIKVALDGGGVKNVPQLCLNCHGGDYKAAQNDGTKKVVVGARFLAWDLATLPTPASVGTQDANFKSLNQLVYLIELAEQRSTSPMAELLTGWYGGTTANASPLFDSNSSYSNGFVPPGWSGNTGMYAGLVAPYCRGCHLALPGREFSTLAGFEAYRALIQRNVCDHTVSNRFMPHAERTFAKFWQSGAPAFVNVDMGAANCKFKL